MGGNDDKNMSFRLPWKSAKATIFSEVLLLDDDQSVLPKKMVTLVNQPIKNGGRLDFQGLYMHFLNDLAFL